MKIIDIRYAYLKDIQNGKRWKDKTDVDKIFDAVLFVFITAINRIAHWYASLKANIH